MERGLMFVMAISDGSNLAVLAAPDCDTDLVAYEMSLLAEAVETC
jgi:predicted regulator of Ras-like GTPase activity (Roadblock/LC7/MglB family)